MTAIQAIISELTGPMRDVMFDQLGCKPMELESADERLRRSCSDGGPITPNRKKTMEALRRRGLLEPCPHEPSRWPLLGRTTDLGEEVVAERYRRQQERSNVRV